MSGLDPMTPVEEEAVTLAKAVLKLMDSGFVGHDGMEKDEDECHHLMHMARNSADWILKQAYPGKK